MRRLLVASTGGHLTELVELASRLVPRADQEVWVTFDNPQSRSLLQGREVQYVRDTPPRDWRAITGNAVRATRLLDGVESVVSTGAGIALSFLPLARLYGASAHYIECSARVLGPSVTARGLRLDPSVTLYTQYPALADRRWNFAGAIWDGFSPGVRPERSELKRVFVTVGTLEFRFHALFDRLKSILPTGVEVVIQAGPGKHEIDWPGTNVLGRMGAHKIQETMEWADVTVSHAGIGTALTALQMGVIPILVPRRRRRREHVDDHQEQIASHLSDRGLAIATEVEELTLETLYAGSRGLAVRRGQQPNFVLR